MAEPVTLGSFATLQNSSIVATLNSNNGILETALADCLSLSGTTPNSMLSNLDMNSFQILNLPAPATINSPVRVIDIQTGTGGGSSINFGLPNVWTALNTFSAGISTTNITTSTLTSGATITGNVINAQNFSAHVPITYSGSTQGTTQYGFNINQNLAGTISAASSNLTANTITVNTDTTIPQRSTYWLNVVGNVGNPSWIASHAYTLNTVADNGGNTYKVTTPGTSASSGGPSGTGSAITDGSVVWNYVSSAWGGSRSGISSNLSVLSQTSSSGIDNTNRQIQAAIFSTAIRANQGGTDTSGNTAGAAYAYAGQMFAQSGATNLTGIVGNETDVGIFTGASSRERIGIQVIAFGDLQGARNDIGYRLGVFPESGSNPTTLRAPGFKIGLGLEVGSLDPTGSIISYVPPFPGSIVLGQTVPENPPTLGVALNLNAYNCTTAVLSSSGGFLLDSNGALNVGPAQITPASVGLQVLCTGSFVTAVAVNAAGTNYVAGDQLFDTFGTIITVASVTGSNGIATLTLTRKGGTTTGSPPATAVSFQGGSGLGATFNITWATPTQIQLGTTTESLKLGGSAMYSANASVATALTSIGPVGSHTTVQTWLTIVDSGGTTRYIPCF